MNENNQHPGKSLDVVCNSYVGLDEDKAIYKGQSYYFCCMGCMKLFLDDPEKYLNKKSEESQG